MKLLDKLSSVGFAAIGTVRENRIDVASSFMISSEDIKEKSRGTYDYRCNGDLYVCKRNDNSIVDIASNFLTHEPVFWAKRRVRGQGTVEVSQPNVIQAYNK